MKLPGCGCKSTLEDFQLLLPIDCAFFSFPFLCFHAETDRIAPPRPGFLNLDVPGTVEQKSRTALLVETKVLVVFCARGSRKETAAY